MSIEKNYYSGYKLLNKKDLDGRKPELYFCVGTRRGGKTFFYNDYVFSRFAKHEEKFLLLFRYNNELYNVSENFFGDIGKNKYTNLSMDQKFLVKDKIVNLYLKTPEKGSVHCGYACSLNATDAVKKNSHFLNDTARMLFDEFMPEDNRYLPDELKKFQSIYTSLSRKYGQQYRYLPTIFVSNAVTLLNPYFSKTDIPERLRENTKFLRGHGYVLENSNIHVDGLEESGVYRAFDSEYSKYASENVYLNDDITNIIKRPSERNQYFLTFSYKNKDFAIRKYADCLYVDRSVDVSNSLKLSADKNIKPGFVSKNFRPEILQFLRNYYNQGSFRFKDLESKVAAIKFLSF